MISVNAHGDGMAIYNGEVALTVCRVQINACLGIKGFIITCDGGAVGRVCNRCVSSLKNVIYGIGDGNV